MKESLQGARMSSGLINCKIGQKRYYNPRRRAKFKGNEDGNVLARRRKQASHRSDSRSSGSGEPSVARDVTFDINCTTI